MYVCAYVRTYVCMDVKITGVCVCVCVCVYTYVCIRNCKFRCMTILNPFPASQVWSQVVYVCVCMHKIK